MAEPARPALDPPARVAFIGLGNMGVPMSARLIGAGYRVQGFDRATEARERFAREASGRPADRVEEVVTGADAIITMLPNGKIVREVIDAIANKLQPGTIIIDMSSSDPLATRALGAEITGAGLAFVDAPVSGGVKRAVDGSLAIMVGGDEAAIVRVLPVLNAMGRSIFRTGAIGSGHAMKALNNYVSGAGLIAAIEALEVGRAFGLDANVIVDVLNASTGRNNSTEVKLKQYVISESYASGFSLGLMAKDISTADNVAHALGVAVPLADRTAALWEEAARRIGGDADHTAVYRGLRGASRS
ncbi:MAG: NAD(P)-dependent oxidoreductase [Beijerinckiaceae bacterium]